MSMDTQLDLTLILGYCVDQDGFEFLIFALCDHEGFNVGIELCYMEERCTMYQEEGIIHLLVVQIGA